MHKHNHISKSVTIDGLNIQVLRKDIRTIRFVVKPPSGEVRISVPKFLDDASLRIAITERLPWIRQQQKVIATLPRLNISNYCSGEQQDYFGKSYYLDVHETSARPTLKMAKDGRIHLAVPPGTTRLKKEKLFNEWYRTELKKRIPGLIARWEPVVGKQVSEWRVKNMKTRWGSCNINHRRIWLSLALAKKPEECLEYVIVHEMTHLIERYHNHHFHGLMDTFMPDWRSRKEALEK